MRQYELGVLEQHERDEEHVEGVAQLEVHVPQLQRHLHVAHAREQRVELLQNTHD